MPAVGKTTPTDLYKEVREEGHKRQEKNDCSVVAVSLFAGVQYDVAHNALRDAGRLPHSGAYRNQVRDALLSLGVHIVEINVAPLVQAYPGVHVLMKNVTTHQPRRFKDVWDGMPNLIMFSRTHCAAYIEGKVHDWSVNNALRVITSFVKVEEAKLVRAHIEAKLAARGPVNL